MQRRVEAHDSLDDFPTPPWATRALCEFLASQGLPLGKLTGWEPCCNRGYMVLPMREYLAFVRASDVVRYPDWVLGDEPELIDFATTGHTEPMVDVIVANPPFNLGEAFIHVALGRARVAVAMFVRSAFVEGENRYERLYSKRPPDFELHFAERVVILRGRLVQAGKLDPFADKPGTKASTATSYSWLVWMIGGAGDTRARWIAPCRRRLERPGDYPVYPTAVLAPGGMFGAVA
ncbi:hypothetical protein TS85_11490 [Sphingomonas hengshuiensis]|uniref:Methyltransferase n=2 Tax=Sphingomonas hengshuiensis TaxID=1609977 RepID=A0A7U4J8M4_9SPHN|nr:hypothetical protein TS85_11490 [Sphingomonas hengshuiensis]